jgi:EAL domain-containing protein (putative c-di-GMP-specific phosphodiesterase class I)
MLAHIVYKSRCQTPIGKQALEALRAQFDHNNQRLDVTGVLLCDGVYFLQVLEGKRLVLEKLYQKILADPRHQDVATLLSAPVPRRIFAECGMHLITTRPGQWVDPGELAPLFQHDVNGSIEDRTHAILRAFTSGRWRERTVPRVQLAKPVGGVYGGGPLPRVVPLANEAACFAFQPIVNPVTQRITAVEALLRGPDGAAPHVVLNRFSGRELHLFDFQSKASAFSLARRLNIQWPLSINLLPSSLLAVDNAAEVLLTEARRHGFGPADFIVEITEEEAISNPGQFMQATDALRAAGIQIAIDDFGAGFAGLSLLASFQPDRLKIDMSLVRGVDRDGPRQAILRAIVDCCVSLGIKLVCEGVETEAEMRWLLEHEISDFQGYLFARPLLAGIPDIHWPVSGPQAPLPEIVPLLGQITRRFNIAAPTREQVDAAVANPVRLRAVRRLKLLDTAPEPTFDRLVKLAAKHTRAPVAFLSLVDDSRDFYKAAFGFGEPLASRRQLEGRTFCHYALLSEGPLVLEDVAAEDVFRDVPTVQTLGVRAYLGVPLVLKSGEVVGSLCVVDFSPRRWAEDDIALVTELAQSVMREFEIRANGVGPSSFSLDPLFMG